MLNLQLKQQLHFFAPDTFVWEWHSALLHTICLGTEHYCTPLQWCVMHWTIAHQCTRRHCTKRAMAKGDKMVWYWPPNVYCTLHNVHWTIYTGRYTAHSVHTAHGNQSPRLAMPKRQQVRKCAALRMRPTVVVASPLYFCLLYKCMSYK